MAVGLEVLVGVEFGEVWEQAGRDRLEELHRRAGDHQEVYHRRRGEGAPRGAIGGEGGDVQDRLLASHDHQRGDREAAAFGQSEISLLDVSAAGSGVEYTLALNGLFGCFGRRARVERLLLGGAFASHQCQRHNEQADHRAGEDAHCDHVLPRGEPEHDGQREHEAHKRLDQHQ